MPWTKNIGGDKVKYQYWFAALQGISDRKKILLHQRMNTARNIYYIEETQLKQCRFLTEKERNIIIQIRQAWKLDKEYESLLKKQIHIVTCFEEGYPEKLKEIPDYPYVIYYKGTLPKKGESAAIVGARQCTPYGEKYARLTAKTLSEAGVQIISGMAKGIDGIAQRAALEQIGKTYAVLGCGVDICYPAEHIGLYHDILAHGGGILSEFPPGTPPKPYHFPRRNRIISGLSDMVLVIEAKEKSGSLITADMALEQGKDVYALPGPLDSALSQGCNKLIYEGAIPVLSVKMLLQERGLEEKQSEGKMEETKKVLESAEYLVYSSLCLYPKSVNDLLKEVSLPAREVICTLTALEMKGYIREQTRNHYVREK